MIRGIDHIGLTVPDLEAAVHFLATAFGCREEYRIGPFSATDDWMSRRLGVPKDAVIPQVAVMSCGDGARLEVFQYDVEGQRQDGPNNSDVGGHHVAFYTDDMDAALRRVREADGIVLDAATEMMDGPSTGETWVYVRAPWGGQFELVHRSASFGSSLAVP